MDKSKGEPVISVKTKSKERVCFVVLLVLIQTTLCGFENDTPIFVSEH